MAQMKGRNAVYKKLFLGKEEEGCESPLTKRKGRSGKLLALRNECLSYRYYYFVKIKQYNYEKALALLEDEFCLKVCTLCNLLTEQQPLLKRIIAAKTTKQQLATKYPHLTWN